MMPTRLFFCNLFFCISLFLVGCSSETESESDKTLANKKVTGSSSVDLLTNDKTKLVVEIVSVENFEPSAMALEEFRSFIDRHCHKPSGIEFRYNTISSPGKDRYTIDDIVETEETHRTAFNDEETVSVFVLMLDGRSERDTDESVILGTAYRNTSFVIFQGTIKRLNPYANNTELAIAQATVINHEFSHLLGLVNLGTPMVTVHEDEENKNHCQTENCLMNYKADAGISIGNLTRPSSVPELDAFCLEDLRALGGK
ncbi:membrane metalloprotease [Robertkochia aurantiaca]|uniref:membrane metalloprotease n=1 Tax=Robertkochia aurantiaca TaxID=2873700 RepID=UPI001CC8FD23|nr:membrane metalloprotease [Robertkochia sp. 3YJGBD-33]